MTDCLLITDSICSFVPLIYTAAISVHRNKCHDACMLSEPEVCTHNINALCFINLQREKQGILLQVENGICKLNLASLYSHGTANAKKKKIHMAHNCLFANLTGSTYVSD